MYRFYNLKDGNKPKKIHGAILNPNNMFMKKPIALESDHWISLVLHHRFCQEAGACPFPLEVKDMKDVPAQGKASDGTPPRCLQTPLGVFFGGAAGN